VVWIGIFQLARLLAMATGRRAGIIFASLPLGMRPALGMWLSQIPAPSWERCSSFFCCWGCDLFSNGLARSGSLCGDFSALKSLGSSYPAIDLPTTVLVYAIAALIVFRFGLVSLACAIFTVDLLANLPFSADFSAWYIGTSMFALIGVVALAAWGFTIRWARAAMESGPLEHAIRRQAASRTRPVP